MPYITSDATASLNFFKDSKIAMTGLQAENLTEAMRMGWQIRQHRDGTVFYIDFNYRDGRGQAGICGVRFNWRWIWTRWFTR